MIEDAIVKVKEAEAKADEIVASARRQAAQIRRQAEEDAARAKEEALAKADSDRKEAKKAADALTAVAEHPASADGETRKLPEDQRRAAIDAVIGLALK